jgi:large subunit ribosomal protein L18
MASFVKSQARQRRHSRIRKHMTGTSQKPRMCIYRSTRNLNVQLVDDIQAKTIISLSTLSKTFRAANKSGGNVKAAQALGELLAKHAKDKGIANVVFDRGGYLYHGRVKAFAEAARGAGLKF